MWKTKKFWLIVLVSVVVIWGLLKFFKDDDAGGATQHATYRTSRGPLTISVTVSGTIKAREMTIIKNEVEGQTTIISLIPEGTRVKEGDLLVELDASSLNDQRLDQEITVQKAEAAFVSAKENLAVVQNQAQSDIDLAELTLQFAKEDLQKYIDGDYPNELKKAEAQITLAQEELTRAQETLKWSQKLFEEKYLSQTELQADELLEKKKKLDLELAKDNMNLLTEFTQKRNLTQLQSDVNQAEMALDRVKRKANADVIQVEAELKAKELEDTRQKDKLRKIEEQIQKAKIYAPSDGLVIYATSAQTGGRRFSIDPLIEGRFVREREELIYLPTTTSAKVEVSIHESNLNKVDIGLPVIVTVNALPGRKFLGTVAKIAPLPDPQSVWMNPDLKVYNTEIFLEDSDETLRTGQSCQAEIIVAQYDDCLYVPVQAVIQVGKQPTVFVVKRGKIEERPVELGLDNNRMVRIISGLAKDEEVMLAPPLKAGSVDRTGTPASGDTMGQRISERLNNVGTENAAGPSAQQPSQAAEPTERPADASGPQDGSRQKRQRPDLQNLTPEQREQMRQRFEKMTPEEREKVRQLMSQQGGSEGDKPQAPSETPQ